MQNNNCTPFGGFYLCNNMQRNSLISKASKWNIAFFWQSPSTLYQPILLFISFMLAAISTVLLLMYYLSKKENEVILWIMNYLWMGLGCHIHREHDNSTRCCWNRQGVLIIKVDEKEAEDRKEQLLGLQRDVVSSLNLSYY